MKLYNFYSHTFHKGKSLPSQIINKAIDTNKCNGVYLCLDSILDEGLLAKETIVSAYGESNIVTWVNLLQDGNYLYGENLEIIESSPIFNNKPVIEFSSDGNTYLDYKFPVTLGSIILVYALKESGSYIIYSPKMVPNTNPPLMYDSFPPNGENLWGFEPIDEGKIYSSNSYINGSLVEPDVFLPLNSARILTVTNIPTGDEVIQGFGGSIGKIGGGEETFRINSFKGYLAAVLTFNSLLTDEERETIEIELAKYYIKYTGAYPINIPEFRYLYGDDVSYNLADLFIDEWFEITNYAIKNPVDVGLSINGTLLQGTIEATYEGNLIIEVTNSANIVAKWSFPLVLCKEDPIVYLVPNTDNLEVILSSSNDGALNNYGLYENLGVLTKWEDARRVGDIITFTFKEDTSIAYISSNTEFNNNPTVYFSPESNLANPQTISSKTFVWVYSQSFSGNRNMLDTFPDIRGDGTLWTVSEAGQMHGSNNVTKLETFIQRIKVPSLSYKLPLNTVFIIIARVPETETFSVDFSGFTNLRGHLAFFASWSTSLTDNQITNLVALLAGRYYSDLSPYIFNSNREYKTSYNLSVDLTKKVVDLRDLPLTYNLLTPYYDADINNDGLFTMTGVKDEVLDISIEVLNSEAEGTILDFELDIVVRTNPLYLDLRTYFPDIKDIFICDLDTLTIESNEVSTWEEYRYNSKEFTANEVIVEAVPEFEDKNALIFSSNGSSYIESISIFEGKTLILMYLRNNEATGRAFLFGQDSISDFISGVDGVLWDDYLTSYKILLGDTYVNSKSKEPSYTIPSALATTIVITSPYTLSFNSLAKDILFPQSSIKGAIAFLAVLDYECTKEQAYLINKILRDYYDTPKAITLCHFENNYLDSSSRNKNILGNSVISSSISKFGSSSLILVSNSECSFIQIPNNKDFAFLHEDFSLTFQLSIDKFLYENDRLVLYNQTELKIYIEEDKLYLGNTLFKELAFITISLSAYLISGNFHHYYIHRNKDLLEVYINGVKKGEYLLDIEILDYNSPIVVGQTGTLQTPAVNVYLDELYIYRRNILYNSDFTPPTSPYS